MSMLPPTPNEYEESIARYLENVAAEVREYGLVGQADIKHKIDAVSWAGFKYGTFTYKIKLKMDTKRPVPEGGAGKIIW